MKIEKLTDNKIRIIVKLEELENNNINSNDFELNNVEYQKFFLKILNKAEKEFGFDTRDCKLLIESFSSLDQVFVFTITKFYDLKKNKKKQKFKSSHNIYSLKNPIFQFSSFDEFCDLCKILENANIPLTNIAKKVSLYFYDNTYYLAFLDLNLSYNSFKKLFSLLSEFACIIKNSPHFEAKLLEYGEPIIKQNAFKTAIKYFT